MTSKSLKASITLAAVQVEDAIVFLTDRYLKATKTTCRTVQTPTDFCWVDLCQPLIEGWIAGQKVSYGKGKITLIFRSGELSKDPDIIIYSPTRGDRFLYTKPQRESIDQLSFTLDASSESNSADDAAHSHRSPLSLLNDLLARQSGLEEKLKHVLDAQADQTAQLTSLQEEQEENDAESSIDSDQPSVNGETLDAFAQTFRKQIVQHVRENLTAALQPVQNELADLREQLAELTERLEDLEDLSLEEDLPIPQSLQEWQERINQTWGTVGDYERYNASYRDANAETPLHETPDWVALCELDWARELCP
ncbi:MAG: hypothetical protein VKL39_15170, partial [Leptolyngbyaceae bacterium]|nr:hypothetical protein [Leptolyngbyaceae bacterium]